MLFSNNFYVLDSETGGFPGTAGFRPVEIALLKCVNNNITLRHFLLDPTDDPTFMINPGAQAVHGITMEKVCSEGVPIKTGIQSLHAELTKNQLPIWGHNGIKFDFPLLHNEFTRYQLAPIPEHRLYDTAAWYKSRKLNITQNPGESFHAFGLRVLDYKQKGLFFSLNHIVNTVPIGLEVKEGQIQTDQSLGIPKELADDLAKLGAHRAGFDVLVTYALLKYLQKSEKSQT